MVPHSRLLQLFCKSEYVVFDSSLYSSALYLARHLNSFEYDFLINFILALATIIIFFIADDDALKLRRGKIIKQEIIFTATIATQLILT